MASGSGESVSVKTHPPLGGVKGGKMGSEARASYIGPISSSERAPYVAFSLKVTNGNVGRAKNCFACGGLSSVLGQISLQIGPVSTSRLMNVHGITA